MEKHLKMSLDHDHDHEALEQPPWKMFFFFIKALRLLTPMYTDAEPEVRASPQALFKNGLQNDSSPSAKTRSYRKPRVLKHCFPAVVPQCQYQFHYYHFHLTCRLAS